MEPDQPGLCNCNSRTNVGCLEDKVCFSRILPGSPPACFCKLDFLVWRMMNVSLVLPSLKSVQHVMRTLDIHAVCLMKCVSLTKPVVTTPKTFDDWPTLSGWWQLPKWKLLGRLAYYGWAAWIVQMQSRDQWRLWLYLCLPISSSSRFGSIMLYSCGF
jgi:hypothetical protein